MQYSGGTATPGPAQYPCQPQGPGPQWGGYAQQPQQPQGPGPYYSQQIPPQGRFYDIWLGHRLVHYYLITALWWYDSFSFGVFPNVMLMLTAFANLQGKQGKNRIGK